jgi:hypothetical protein
VAQRGDGNSRGRPTGVRGKGYSWRTEGPLLDRRLQERFQSLHEQADVVERLTEIGDRLPSPTRSPMAQRAMVSVLVFE